MIELAFSREIWNVKFQPSPYFKEILMVLSYKFEYCSFVALPRYKRITESRWAEL